MSKKVASRNKAPENLLMALKEAQARFGYLSSGVHDGAG